MEISSEYIKAQLQRRAAERQLNLVAAGSGVPLRSVQRMASGVLGTISNAVKVQEFLQRTERDKKLAKENA